MSDVWEVQRKSDEVKVKVKAYLAAARSDYKPVAF